MKLGRTDLVLLLALLVVCGIFYSSAVPEGSFNYDEADYVFAASKGLYANYIDKDNIPFAEYLQTGLGQGLEADTRTSLSEFVRSSGDTAFYRHYHGPLAFYGIAAWSYLAGVDEYAIRLISVLFALGTVVVVYLGCFLLLGSEGKLPALLASVFLISGYSGIGTAMQISTHGVYVLATMAALFLLAKLVQSRDLRYGRYAVVAMAFAFAATEYAPAILLTGFVCVLIFRSRLFPEWSRREYARELGIAVALFAGTIFLIWPAGWLKLSLVKNYIFNAYLALARQGTFGTESAIEAWSRRALNSPLEYTLLGVTAIIGVVYAKNQLTWLVPFLTYALIMFAVTLQITSPSERYISSIFPPLYVVNAAVIWQLLRRWPMAWRVGVACALVFIFSVQGYSNIQTFGMRGSEPELDALVRYFKGAGVGHEMILTSWEFIPTLDYYFPDKEFQSFHPEDEENLVTMLLDSRFSGVIYNSLDHGPLEEDLSRHFDVEATSMSSTGPTTVVYYEIRAKN